MAISKKTKRTLWIVVAVVVAVPIVVALIVLLRLGPIIRIGVEQVGSRVLGVETQLDNASVSLLRGSICFSGLNVKNPEGFESPSFVKAKLIRAGADIGDLFKNEIHIREIILDGPEFTFEHTGTKSNVGVILDNLDAKEGPEVKPDEREEEHVEKEEEPRKLKIDLIRITNAKLHVVLLGQELQLTLPKMELTNLADKDGNAIPPRQVITQIVKSLVGNIDKTVKSAGMEFKGAGKELGKVKGLLKDLDGDLKDTGGGLGKDLKKLFGK